MKYNAIILALLFLLPFGYARGQSRMYSNAGPGLRAPADTAWMTTSIYALPSLPVIPSGNLGELPVRHWGPEAPPMPRAYSYEQLGVFCKWEVKVEKAARMPVKFRLGEVQYVERMEGKLPDY